MSTRGTYRIHVDDGSSYMALTFYVHSDNYPPGAAQHFKRAFAIENEGTYKQWNGMHFLKRFAMLQGTEFTHSHESHGDTEFRYDVWDGGESGMQVECWKRTQWSPKVWESVFDGGMEEFIEWAGKQ
jgi:hypothetical protein